MVYYKVRFNCGRFIYEDSDDQTEYFGFIKVMPSKIDSGEKNSFGNPIYEYDYSGNAYVFVELVNGHFEDIILGKEIIFDPDGFHDMKNISGAPLKVLKDELEKPLTCFSYEEASNLEVANFIKCIQGNKYMIEKYMKEIEYVEKKTPIVEELGRREELHMKKLDAEKEAVRIINDFMKQRKR